MKGNFVHLQDHLFLERKPDASVRLVLMGPGSPDPAAEGARITWETTVAADRWTGALQQLDAPAEKPKRTSKKAAAAEPAAPEATAAATPAEGAAQV